MLDAVIGLCAVFIALNWVSLVSWLVLDPSIGFLILLAASQKLARRFQNERR
jgi:hypothetical protein